MYHLFQYCITDYHYVDLYTWTTGGDTYEVTETVPYTPTPVHTGDDMKFRQDSATAHDNCTYGGPKYAYPCYYPGYIANCPIGYREGDCIATKTVTTTHPYRYMCYRYLRYDIITTRMCG